MNIIKQNATAPRQILPSTSADLDTILNFYSLAIEFQKQVFHQSWVEFDRNKIDLEIKESRQWKIIEAGEIVAIFLIAYNDDAIWGKMKSPAIYLHRIVALKASGNKKVVPEIIEWTKSLALSKGIRFIRMDTWAENQKLINYYVTCGFNFLKFVKPDVYGDLPKHYSGIDLALLEMQF